MSALNVRIFQNFLPKYVYRNKRNSKFHINYNRILKRILKKKEKVAFCWLVFNIKGAIFKFQNLNYIILTNTF